MSEEHIIRNCAPTLAGLKTGSIFLCPYESKDALRHAIRRLNRKLRPKGLRLLPLRFSESRALLYLFRPSRLSSDLLDGTASALLESSGYDTGNLPGCIATLARKLNAQEKFPHEIGLFLGYPPEDVLGFIQNRACHCKCVGCWKVYGDEAAARKKFAQFKKCTAVYCAQWAAGKPLERLTVAG